MAELMDKTPPCGFSPQYLNWIKVGRAIEYARKPIKEFVLDVVRKFHSDNIANIKHPTCSGCTTLNVQPCYKGCTNCGKKCKVHKHDDLKSKRRPCPTDGAPCDVLRDVLIANHRYDWPSWGNTDASRWRSDFWEVAKCFLPRDGYTDKPTADDTDFSGLCSIIINLKKFQEHMDQGQDLSKSDNLFNKAKTMRNTIFHLGKNAVSGAELRYYIDDVLLPMLKDVKEIAKSMQAQEAIRKIEELKTSRLQLSIKDEQQVKNEVEKMYRQDKERIRKDLMKLYEEKYSRTPLYPAKEEEETCLEDVYVEPSLKKLELGSPKSKMEKESSKVTQLKDVLYKGKKSCKNIYLFGNAGVGKTTYCKKLLSTWCKAWNEQHEELGEDERTMKYFEFVFYISLSDATGERSVTDMIKNKLFDYDNDKQFIETILERESNKCLILLDGLDEWEPPENHSVPQHANKQLPERQIIRSQSTILTTTRPWKLDKVRLKGTEKDQLIEVVGFDKKASSNYIHSFIELLNKIHRHTKKASTFEEDLRKANLNHFKSIPLVLQQLICLWFDGRPLGKSQCQVYASVVEFLLERASTGNEAPKAKIQKVQLPRCFDDKKTCWQHVSFILRIAEFSFDQLFQKTLKLLPTSTSLSSDEITFFQNVGLLSETTSTDNCAAREKKYIFLHKTFQEFFAALHLSMVYSRDDLDAGNTIHEFNALFQSLDTAFDLENVLIFLSGMTPELVQDLFDHLSAVVSNDPRIQRYRSSLSGIRHGEPRRCVEQYQNIMLSCSREREDNDHGLPVLQLTDIIMDDSNPKQTSKYFTHLVKYSKGDVKSVYLRLKSESQISMISDINVKNLHKLHISLSGVNGALNEMLLSVLRSSKSMQSLYLCGFDLHRIKPTEFSELFSGLTHLQSVGFKDMKLSHQHFTSLSSFSRSSLKLFSLTSLQCTGCGTGDCRYEIDLRDHNALEKIHLEHLYVENVTLNTDQLSSCHLPTLYRLEALESILDHLESAPKLEDLEVNCRLKSVTHLVQTLPKLTNLRYLSISSIQIGDNKLEISPSADKLERVYLNEVEMTIAAFQAFVDSLHRVRSSDNRCAVIVRMYAFEITDELDNESNKHALEYIQKTGRFEINTEQNLSTPDRSFIKFTMKR